MNYSPEEVRVLVEEYEELRGSSKSFVRVRLMDVTKTIRWVNPKLRRSLVLAYSLHFPADVVGEWEGVDANTVYRRAENGLEELTRKLNGGRHARKPR